MAGVIANSITTGIEKQTAVSKDVLNTSEFVSTFDRQKISDSIFEEINYVASIFNLEQQISREESDATSKEVESRIIALNGNLKMLTGPLIREMVCGVLTGQDGRLMMIVWICWQYPCP